MILLTNERPNYNLNENYYELFKFEGIKWMDHILFNRQSRLNKRLSKISSRRGRKETQSIIKSIQSQDIINMDLLIDMLEAGD